MNTEPSATNNIKHIYFNGKTFFRVGIMYFVIRLLVDVEGRKPIGGEGGWAGVLSLVIEVVITAFLFSLAWQAVINWRRTKSSK